MDINKYIGKFLLKNKYCSLPGLGVFDLKKEGAQANASSETISAPVYKITFTPVGSIDDTFASFIATAENVSISNASNNIKEYCKNVKEELSKSGKYDIEFLGRFSLSNNKIIFHQSDDLDMGVEPAPLAPLVEKLKAPETPANKPDYSYPPARTQRDIPILKIAVPIVLVVLLAVGAYFGYDYYQKNKDVTPVEATIPEPATVQVDTLATTIVPDSLHRADSTNAATDTAMQSASNSAAQTTPQAASFYKVAILSFENEAGANGKATKLKKYGNDASVVSNNGRFFVVINASSNDTTKLVDSLRRFFNPRGQVFIMK
jgi:nucleoid DNA-binding protein